MKNQAWHNRQFQLIGTLPLIIFLYRLVQYLQVGTPDWIMYNCHVTMVLLSAGMVLGVPLLIRIATIWLVIGLPMWLIDAYFIQELWIASIFSHLGGFLLAIYAIHRVRATGQSWGPAVVWFLFWQMITRYTTAPELNINIAHAPYEFSQAWFASYWLFWPLCALGVSLLAWTAECGLARVYPVAAPSPEKQQAW